jgi:hypothetical protein
MAGWAVFLASCGTSSSAVINPTPSVTGVFPSSVTAGTQSFTLYLTGNNFLNGKIANTSGVSTAYWNGTARTTVYNNDTNQLAVSILASDVATSGIAQVTVSNPTPGGGVSPAATFTINPVTNNTPLVSTISPTSAAVNGSSFTITVNGTGFQPSSVIAWNGSPLCPTYVVSSTQLTATVDSTYLTSAALASISVYTPTGGGNNLFSPGVTFTVGTVSGNNLTFPQVVSLSALGGASDGPSEAPAMSQDGRYVAFYSQAKNLVPEGASGNIFIRDTCLNQSSCIPQTAAVDLAPDGSLPNGKVGRQVALSGDGRFVAFISRATNLTANGAGSGGGNASGFTGLYIRDLCTGPDAYANCVPHTDLISVSADAAPVDGPSLRPSLSYDGRFVAFESSASNLVSGVLAQQPGIYVRDTCAGPTAAKSCVPQTFAVAMDEQDRAAYAQGARPAISATGRYVAFEAWSGTDAVVGGAPGARAFAQVVLADTCLGPDAPLGCRATSNRVSIAVDGGLLPGSNFSPAISASGRYVAFQSQPAGNGSTNGSSASRVFVRDTCAGAVSPCSPNTVAVTPDASAAASGKSEAYSPSLSANGRYVSFVAASAASGSSSEGTVNVRDLCFGAARGCVLRTYALDAATPCSTGCMLTTCPPAPSASNANSGLTADKYTPVPISANGRFAAFYAPESIPAQPSNGVGDIFMAITPF